MSGDCRGGGVQKERARAAACFIVRLAGGHDDSGPIAGKDDYFQQLDGRFDRARDAPDRRIFATKDPALPAARKGRGLASVRPARRRDQLVERRDPAPGGGPVAFGMRLDLREKGGEGSEETKSELQSPMR